MKVEFRFNGSAQLHLTPESQEERSLVLLFRGSGEPVNLMPDADTLAFRRERKSKEDSDAKTAQH